MICRLERNVHGYENKLLYRGCKKTNKQKKTYQSISILTMLLYFPLSGMNASNFINLQQQMKHDT